VRRSRRVRHGPYLHDWAYACGADGEGFAPLSMPGHQFITRAALDALPQVCAWLGGEADLLVWTYCGLPDMNWHTYGHIAPASGWLPEVRYPDTRREWEISRYCDYNDLTRAGQWFGHHYPDAGRAAAKHYGRACSAARRARALDAVRLLGAALHYLQDCGSPPHAAHIDPPYHRPAETLAPSVRIAIPGYRPRPHFEIGSAAKRICAFARPRGQRILERLQRDRAAHVLDLQVECADHCAKATANALNDFHRRFGDRLRFQARPTRRHVELLANGDFAEPDDEPHCPAGWALKWWDRHDRDVCIRRQRIGSRWCVSATDVGQRVACLVTWPKAIRVRPGEVYRLSGQVKTPAGGGGLYAELYDGRTRKLCEWHAAAQPSRAWQTLTGAIHVGPSARILRVGAFAENTLGPVHATALSLVRC
jgi:hypothetical protein